MKILKYRLHPGMNAIRQLAGTTHKLRYLNDQDGKLMGWFEVSGEPTDVTEHDYEVYLALTGETIPDEYRYVTSYQERTGGGWFVVHAYD
jgi:hypothetical protein